jgi:Spy/CpxP family protein refolding chaperone
MARKVLGFFALAFVLVVGVATAGVLYAQQSGGMGSMMGMMNMMEDCPMMGAMRESPQAVLKHREELGLTAAQVQKLEAFQEGSKQARMQSMERMKALHGEIAAATKGDTFNEAAARVALDRMGDLHTDMAVAMLRTRQDVRQVLTSEQRQKLGEMGGGMMGMGGMMGGGMMENCPMMQGGMMGEGMNMEGMHHGQGSASKPMQHHPRS